MPSNCVGHPSEWATTSIDTRTASRRRPRDALRRARDAVGVRRDARGASIDAVALPRDAPGAGTATLGAARDALAFVGKLSVLRGDVVVETRDALDAPRNAERSSDAAQREREEPQADIYGVVID